MRIVGNTVYYNKRTYKLDKLSNESKVLMGIIKPKVEEKPKKEAKDEKKEVKKGDK